MDALDGGGVGGALRVGYGVELQMDDGEYVQIDLEVLSGMAALPFYVSPLAADFFAPPPVAPALPADLAGATDVDVLGGLAALPYYGGDLPAGFFADPYRDLLAADLAGPAANLADLAGPAANLAGPDAMLADLTAELAELVDLVADLADAQKIPSDGQASRKLAARLRDPV